MARAESASGVQAVSSAGERNHCEMPVELVPARAGAGRAARGNEIPHRAKRIGVPGFESGEHQQGRRRIVTLRESLLRHAPGSGFIAALQRNFRRSLKHRPVVRVAHRNRTGERTTRFRNVLEFP